MSADRETATAIAAIRAALTRAASPLEFEEGRQAWVDEALAELDSLLDALDQLRAERDTLREYAAHKEGCAALASVKRTVDPWPECNCGLDDALAADCQDCKGAGEVVVNVSFHSPDDMGMCETCGGTGKALAVLAAAPADAEPDELPKAWCPNHGPKHAAEFCPQLAPADAEQERQA